MADLTPSAGMTKIGSLLVIFVIAMLAIYAVNNFASLGKIVAKKTA